MKLSSISSTKINGNSKRVNNNQQKTPSFKGAADSLVKFWQVVDNGGRALQFTVEDMFGTNLPRTYKGAMAGYKYTGKVNVPALLQELIREFLTGPTMCVVPLAVLSAAQKSAGKTSNTHIENIRNLSYLMGETTAQQGKALDDSFVTTVTRDLLQQTVGSADEADVEKLSGQILEYKTALAQKGTDKAARKALKKEAEKKLDTVQATYEQIVKHRKASYQGVDFLDTAYSIGKNKTGTTNFRNYVDYTVSYATDFTKKFAKNTADNVKAFEKTWLGRRAIVIASMIGVTGLCMSIIPKIYTLASGNVNPNAAAIYNEAKSEGRKNEDVK